MSVQRRSQCISLSTDLEARNSAAERRAKAVGRRGGGRERRAAALVAVIVAMLPVGSAFAASMNFRESRATTAAPTQSTWLDLLIEALQILYVLMGGNPSDITSAPDAETAMSTVSSYWAAHGLPSGLTTVQKQAVVAAIDTTSALLNSAPSEVSSSAVSAFRTTLTAIRSLVVVPDDP